MSSPELTPEQRRTELLAKLFDLRMFIGSLFVVFGVIVTLVGFFAGPEEIAKAAGINISLWTGLLMLALGSSSWPGPSSPHPRCSTVTR